MKHQYHVFTSRKDGITKGDLIAQIHEFLGQHVTDGCATEYAIREFTNSGSFPELPEFHITVNYDSEEAMHDGMKAVKEIYKEAPHAPLMKMVKDFKVAFSKEHED